MIVKSGKQEGHIQDLREIIETLRKYWLRLNPNKCVFRVFSWNFLGHMISGQGIEANPEKTRAILEMLPPSTPKQIQSLNGYLTSLRRFISKLA